MAGETICRAREQEIGSLLQPILSRKGRSATLLYGDSGIGKSAVLREIQRRLSAQINITAGFYECVTGDRDPLLRALDDLLKQTYAVHGAFDQIHAACESLKNDPSISPLKEFLLAVRHTAGESAGLGPLAKIAWKYFGWCPGKAGVLDLDAPGAFVPRLGIPVFRSIVTMLRTAFPERQLVFTIDNLSALLESAAAGSRNSGALDNLVAFLSHDYARFSGIHFLLSWKLTPKTKPGFEEMEDTLRKCGGRTQKLGPMAEQGIESWLSDEFPWFRDLGDVQRQSVARLSGGLPQVVRGWREAGIDSSDLIQLREVADSVRTGSFGYLASELEKAPADERQLLLAVALLEHPLTASDLADLLQRPPGREASRACYDALRAWTERRLLRQQVPEKLSASDRAPLFVFEHERKRQVAVATLSGTLADRGKSVHERAYDFLLSRIDLLSLPAEEFFTDALELLGRSRYLADRRAIDTARLRLLADLASMDRKPVEADSAAWELPQDWPRNLQAQFFDLSLRTGYGDREKISGRLEGWLSGRRTPPAYLGRARALAAPLRNLAFHALSLYSSRLLGRILWELRDLQAAFGSSAEIAEAFGGTASLAAKAAAGHREFGNLDVMLGFLRNLHRTFPERYSMAESLAKTLVLAAALHSKLGRAGVAEELLPELRDLAARFPERAWTEQAPGISQAHAALDSEGSVTEELANALARAAPAHCERLEMGRFEELAGQLRVLQRAFPKDVGIALNYAESITCGLAAYAKLRQPEPVERLLDEARDLAKSFAWDPRFRWGGLQFREHSLPSEAGKPALEAALAPGLPRHIEELIAAARQAGLHRLEQERHLFKLLISAIASAASFYSDMREADRFAARLGDLRALHNMFPQQTNIAIALSLALGKGVQLYAGRHEEDQAEKLLEELESLENELDGQPLIAEQMAKAAALVIAAFGGPQNTRRVDEWVRAVRRAERKYSGEAPIARWAATAMANASSIYARLSRVADIEAILLQLRKLHEQSPADAARAEAFALALTNAMLCYFELQHDSMMEPLLRELRVLATRFPGQPSFAAHAASGLRVSVWAVCHSGGLEKAEERLVELHGLRGAYPNEPAVAAAWQQALAFYNRRRAGASPRAAVIAEELALAIAAAFQQRAGSRAQAGRLEADLAAIRDLWRAHSESSVIGDCLSAMLSRAAKLYAQSGEMAKADALSDELRRLQALLPGTPHVDATRPTRDSIAQMESWRALTKS